MIYDEKYRLLVAQKYYETGNAKATAIAFNVTVRSVYRWGKLYADDGENSLKKKSRSPKTKVNLTNDATEKKVVDTWFSITSKRTYSSVKRKLAEQEIDISVPTIKAILKRREEIKK